MPEFHPQSKREEKYMYLDFGRYFEKVGTTKYQAPRYFEKEITAIIKAPRCSLVTADITAESR